MRFHTQDKRVRKDFEVKHLGGYHDLSVKSDTLLPFYVFNNFQNIYLQVFSFCIRISMASSIKKDVSKIRFIN